VSVGIEQRREWFASYQNDGEDDALFAILEAERDGVFDYLIRHGVTSEQAMQLLEGLPAPIIASAANIGEIEELRTTIFKSARQQALSFINVVNIPPPNQGYVKDQERVDPMEVVLIKTIEGLVMDLPLLDREPIVLHYIHNFNAHEISQITERSEKDVGECLARFINEHQSTTGITQSELSTSLQQIPLHPVKAGSGISTVALSQVVGDLRKARPKRITRRMILGGVLVLVGLAGLYYFYQPF